MFATLARTFIFCIIFLSLLSPAEAKRVALVIGNSAYRTVSPLDNPKNDAELMARTLEELGFEVHKGLDADRNAMSQTVRTFGKSLRAAGKDAVGLFYYAGHGIQALGQNYLLPVDSVVESAADLTIETLNVSDVLAQMEEAANALNIIILDACRNNPLKSKVRNAGRGLARIDAASGTLIAFSAAPGQVATDGSGKNSPYTSALVRAMKEPGLPVEQMFKRVRVSVEKQTGGVQTPWEESSLRGDFFFVSKRSKPSSYTSNMRHEFQDCATCPLMVRLPKGTAILGYSDWEMEEYRPNWVTINSPFALGKYEVTVSEFSDFMRQTGHKTEKNCVNAIDGKTGIYDWENPGFEQDELHPVTCVSWADAKAYTNWLRKKTGKKYRLMSHEEFYYASRGINSTTWHFGNDAKDLCRYSNAADKSTNFRWKNSLCSDGVAAKTSEVGRYEPSPFGIHDLLGNVWEWIESCWFKEEKTGKCLTKGFLGGSWESKPVFVGFEIDFGGVSDDHRRNDLGFRVARDLTSQELANSAQSGQ